MKQWYEELFKDYADKYDQESFTKGTIGEVDFIENELNYDKAKKILDIGCGTGRHSIELAKRGYKVTGFDLSESLLNKAIRIAKDNKLEINFLKKDARDFNFNCQYDLAIMICEGAFPLMETDEMNYKILKNIHSSLKDNGKLIFTTLNGLFPLVHSVKDFLEKNQGEGESQENTFDLMTFRDYSIYETIDDLGNKKILNCNERYYVPSEISWLLKSLGFKKTEIFGCKLGAFSRNDELTTEDFEMLVITEK
ncbi:MAG: methyltransferase domain-containing protein [Bacteroidetes bacterium]|nr:methyltransferase domain-containing protein [Bacteroidota bacterium]